MYPPAEVRQRKNPFFFYLALFPVKVAAPCSSQVMCRSHLCRVRVRPFGVPSVTGKGERCASCHWQRGRVCHWQRGEGSATGKGEGYVVCH